VKSTAPLADYGRDADKEPVIVTKRGRPVAALIPIENADDETVSLSTNRRFLALIERSRRRHETEGGISTEEMRRRLGLSSTTSKRKPGRTRSR
jgi:antitoxin (DNA-binding transcriptional repressor) of toxin-antitoxin stability system